MTKIALISDVHFGPFSRTPELSVSGESIKDQQTGNVSLVDTLVSALRKEQVEYLFVSGDLTTSGSPKEFFFFQKFLQKISEQLEITDDRIVLGIGNHDIHRDLAKLFDDAVECNDHELFEIARHEYQKNIPSFCSMNTLSKYSKYSEVGVVPFSGVIERDSMIIFVLNSAWLGSAKDVYSHGKLSKMQLDWYGNKSFKYRDDKRWKITLMHHHPFNYTFPDLAPDISTLEEGSSLLEIAGENGMNLILHGHRHHPITKTILETGWREPISFICAGSLSVNAEHRSENTPNTFHIIDLPEKTGVFRLYNYEYIPNIGWAPFSTPTNRERKEAPLDDVMIMGISIGENDKIIKEIICSLPENSKLLWDDLDDRIRCLGYNKLNEKVRSMRSNVVGRFPEIVVINPVG